MSDEPSVRRTRREPPAFRHVVVRRIEDVGARMVRVTLTGPDLAGLTVETGGESALPCRRQDRTLVVPT